MHTLSYNGMSWTVDHAVKGADYVHGYAADGSMIIAIEHTTDLDNIVYDGTYINPDKCLEEVCNTTKLVNGRVQTIGGTPVEARHVGAASANFGYGETMKWLGFNPSTWTSTDTFQADLEAAFDALPQGTCMQVQFIDTNLSTQKFTGTLWRYTTNYGVLTAVNYSGVKAIKGFYDGVWQPWEWENPPMNTGTEYRTTERYNGKPVYAKNVSFGKLPNATEKTVEHGLGGGQIDTFVSFKVLAYDTETTTVRNLPYFTSSGAVRADAYVTSARVGVMSYIDLSKYNAVAQLRYTRV